MRNTRLHIASEDNPLVREFYEKIYLYMPSQEQEYFNQSFDLKTHYDDTVFKAKELILFCRDYSAEPDFDIDLTVATLDVIISNGRKMLEYVKNNGLPKDITIDGKSKELETFKITPEVNELKRKLKLPNNMLKQIALRAYCEYLKTEALKQPSEQPIEDYPSSFYPFIKEGLLIPSKEGLVNTCLSVRDLIFEMTKTGYRLPKTRDIHTYVVQARICTEGSIKQYRLEAKRQNTKKSI